MGVGIWSMHYIGMLAFQLPVAVQYDWPTVLLSLLAAVGASWVALFVVSRETMTVPQAIVGSLFMGGGIAAMHYIGMEAMRLPAMCHYSAEGVGLSIFLAIVIAFAALQMSYAFRGGTGWSWSKAFTAVTMGAAIPIMHYVGMAAVTFVEMPPEKVDLTCDGAELGRIIFNDDTLDSTRLILVTSSGQRGEGHLFADIGFAGYLLKPVAQRDLTDCLMVALASEADTWQMHAKPMITRHALRAQRPSRRK
jgi:NO-binding membrane sensor protein with MHYT domain